MTDEKPNIWLQNKLFIRPKGPQPSLSENRLQWILIVVLDQRNKQTTISAFPAPSSLTDNDRNIPTPQLSSRHLSGDSLEIVASHAPREMEIRSKAESPIKVADSQVPASVWEERIESKISLQNNSNHNSVYSSLRRSYDSHFRKSGGNVMLTS